MMSRGYRNWHFIEGDAEIMKPFCRFNLIVSASAFQWFLNMKDFFDQVAGFLADDGLLIFSSFGRDNLVECRNITGKGLHYADMERIQEMLSDKFEILYSYEERIKIKLDSPLDVLKHLQYTGVNGIKGQGRTKEFLNDFSNKYLQLYRYQDGVSLTYHPIYITAKKKNEA